LAAAQQAQSQAQGQQIRLFLGDLSYFCLEQDLLNLFAPYGSILQVHIRRGVRRNSLMHGFIILQSVELGYRAIQDINEMEFMGRNIK
jgi:RNA recognition motif-containing protein